MKAQVRSEVLKLRTTRATGVLLAAAVAITMFGAVVEGVSVSVVKLAEESSQRSIFGANVTAVLLATVAGILIVTSEFRYGTIHPTLLFEPRRSVVLGAKLVAAALTGIAIALACTAGSFATGYAFLVVRDVAFTISGAHVLELSLGTAAASVLGALIGVALGELIRTQLTVIAALLAYAVAVDAALFGAAPQVGRYLPGKAGDALAGRAVDNLLAPGPGGLVFALWAGAFVIAAFISTRRRDVVPR